jgi:hypothetical protein
MHTINHVSNQYINLCISKDKTRIKQTLAGISKNISCVNQAEAIIRRAKKLQLMGIRASIIPN